MVPSRSRRPGRRFGPQIRAADSGYREDAPAFCFMMENLEGEDEFNPAEGDMTILLDFFSEVEQNSTNDRIVELVDGLAGDLQPYAEVIPEFGGDEEAALEGLDQETRSVVVQRLALLTHDGPTIITAVAGECLAFELEDTEDEVSEDGSVEPDDAAGTAAQPGTTVVAAEGEEAQTGGTVVQQLDVLATGAVTLASPSNLFSIDPNKPNVGLAQITIDRVHSASALETTVAAVGDKLVVVDYRVQIPPEVIAAPITTDFMQALVDGTAYSPSAPLNEFLMAGDILNATAVFAVPVETEQFQLEIGPPSGSTQGLTAVYDVAMAPDLAATAHIEAQAAVDDATIVAQVESVDLVEGNGSIAPNVRQVDQGTGQLTVLNVESVQVAGNNVAGALEKFVVADVQFLLDNGVAVTLVNSTYRLEANGELYGPVNAVNEFVLEGEASQHQVIFRVPRTAVDLVLQAGALPDTAGGVASSWAIKLPDVVQG